MSEDATIPGLRYVADFVTPDEATALLAAVDAETWRTDLKRRTQHYGYRYDYTARSVDVSMRLGELPEWAATVAARLAEQGLADRVADQLIVNEYEPGQGIASHIDCEPCFDGNVASLSLGSSCIMDFTHKDTGKVIPVVLEPRSLVVLTGDARNVWKHGITGRKSDRIDGRTVPRGRRVSLTFRKVILA